LGEDPKEVDVQRSDWVIGGEAFRRRMCEAAERPAPRRRGRPGSRPEALIIPQAQENKEDA
jgi:hypothetical protein